MRIYSFPLRLALGGCLLSHPALAQQLWSPFLGFGSDASMTTGAPGSSALLIQPGAFMESPRGSMLARWSSTADPTASQFGSADLDLRTRVSRFGRFESSVLATAHYEYGTFDGRSPSAPSGTGSLRFQIGGTSPSAGFQLGLGVDSWRSSLDQRIVPASSVSGWVRRFGLSFSAEVSAHAVPGASSSSSSAAVDSGHVGANLGPYVPQTGPDTLIPSPLPAPVSTTPTTNSSVNSIGSDFAAHTFGQARLHVSGVLMSLGLEADGGVMMATHGTTRGFGSVILTHWLSESVAITGGLVLQPPEPGSASRRSGGLLGLRLADARQLIPHFVNAPKAGVGSISVRVADGNAVVELRAPGVSHVEISGDFTHWLPVALERGSGDHWTLMTKMAPGVHHLIVRVDGGEWRPPPGISQTVDLYEGTVGVIVVG